MDGEVILVAIDASKEITDYALEWAVQNVIKAYDSLVLLAILPSGRRPPAAGNNSSLIGKREIKDEEQNSSDKASSVSAPNVPQKINNVCAQMMQQLFSMHNVVQVSAEVKVVADAQIGSVAKAAEGLCASWVILDRRLKKECDRCLKELNCTIILVDHAIPKILRTVNFTTTMKKLDERGVVSDPTVADMLGVLPTYSPDNKSTMTRSSLGFDSPNLNNDTSSSLSSSENNHFQKTSPSVTKFKPTNTPPGMSIHFSDHDVKNEESSNPYGKSQQKAPKTPPRVSVRFSDHDVQNEAINSSNPYGKSQQLDKLQRFDAQPARKSTSSSINEKTRSYNSTEKNLTDARKKNLGATTLKSPDPTRRTTDSGHLSERNKSLNQSGQPITRREPIRSIRNEVAPLHSAPTMDRTSSIRKAMSLSTKKPPTPPPLCSVCKHNAPIFGKAPRMFSYQEIERATDGFSRENFLAEGGYGPVYRGVLPDGQVVAVKQHTKLSAQGASEFCSEVEVLSCAQHRNLVMLVGYCIETAWLLIYEFACNGSLDRHLNGTQTTEVLAWDNRMKVAVGAARGLRYLHEDCRVGCIVHRDFRPCNILITHDFEPMVGDFGLARWQANGQSAEETRVIGAFGYLAPEYTQTGLITEKADVYAFGVVLLELLTGTKATEFSRNSGQQFLPYWANNHVAHINFKVVVLKILEGDMTSGMGHDQGHPNSIYPNPNPSFNGYTTDRQWNQRVDSRLNMMQPVHHFRLSPPRRSVHINSGRTSTFRQTPSYSDYRSTNGDGDFYQSGMLLSEEFQEYLQGTMSKYAQNTTAKQRDNYF
ncbi:unnamed protein product [Ilex paraguariensis]|uniref:non-specific serine/threonine protein kinase n=1 Tax=Ilex paraguariensis TaxID=185542 RepID=A0ABC8SXJ0_9AQUA